MSSYDDYMKLMGAVPLPFVLNSEAVPTAPGNRPLPYVLHSESEAPPRPPLKDLLAQFDIEQSQAAKLKRSEAIMESGTIGPAPDPTVASGLREGVEMLFPTRGINRLWNELQSPPMRPQPGETVDLKLNEVLTPPGFPPLPFEATVKVPRLADLIAGAASDVTQQGLGALDVAAAAPMIAKGYMKAGRSLGESGQLGAKSAKDSVKTAIKGRGIKGDVYLNSLDLYDDLTSKGAEISKNGLVTLYHRTTPENAQKIVQTGKMIGKEDRLFFGTHPEGQIEGYGEAAVKVKVPIEQLELNDVFTNEAHLTLKGSKAKLKAELWTPAASRSSADIPQAELMTLAPDERAHTILSGLPDGELKAAYLAADDAGKAQMRQQLLSGQKAVEASTTPPWAVPETSREVLGETVWESRFAKGKYISDNGNIKATPEEAAKDAIEWRKAAKESEQRTAKKAETLDRIKSGEYTDQDLITVTETSLKFNKSTAAKMEGILRDFGVRPVDSKKVLKSLEPVDTTPTGVVLYNTKEVIEKARESGLLESYSHRGQGTGG